uniref:Uncharacterized protein n=1 Tax=Sphenodon punctatus TaxID=8508 RepID=A0A8D0HT12_SPHPU
MEGLCALRKRRPRQKLVSRTQDPGPPPWRMVGRAGQGGGVRHPPQLGRSTGRAQLTSRVAAAAPLPSDGEGGHGASARHGSHPAPLRAPAQPTQPLELILILKLRIRLAEFPYLHCSNMPEVVHLGDLLWIWVRSSTRFTPSPPDFQGPVRAHRTPPEPQCFPRRGPLSQGETIPGHPALHKEKRTVPGSPASFSGIGRISALDALQHPSLPLWIWGSEPDSLSIG